MNKIKNKILCSGLKDRITSYEHLRGNGAKAERLRQVLSDGCASHLYAFHGYEIELIHSSRHTKTKNSDLLSIMGDMEVHDEEEFALLCLYRRPCSLCKVLCCATSYHP